ncbi:hypothetical protein L0657_06835 [Dyadobacter sp. CY345]|uniref:hypothetical protein n=1 Tax=Dyadobacter sp. CY345 TaxID=2909335 RepID=UPI001F359300|nr:hypothetical protein [Dyadobacter sp. CY345]MCF2443666.1 hypothetical protein [Dyadobacter sp. CY345]
MSKRDESYPDHKLWRDGTRQELIADPGEGLDDAIGFMKASLAFYKHRDLTFFRNEIKKEGNSYWFTLRKTDPKRNRLFRKESFDKVLT